MHQMLAVAGHDLQLGIRRESILMDAPTYESVDREELLANANDLRVWVAAVRNQDPELRNDGKAANKLKWLLRCSVHSKCSCC